MGWIDSKAFFGYIANVFHKFLLQKQVPLPVILFVDGHPSHQSPEVSEFCNKNEIILFRFPPHATHALQPCDLALFWSLKSAWYDAERAYRSEHLAELSPRQPLHLCSATRGTELPRTKNWPRVDSEQPAYSHTPGRITEGILLRRRILKSVQIDCPPEFWMTRWTSKDCGNISQKMLGF